MIFSDLVVFIGIAAAVVLVLNLLASAALAVYLCRPRKKTYLDDYFFTPFETDVPYEPVSLVTRDNVTLAGWWLAGTGKRVVVGLAGRSGIKSDLLGVGSRLAKAGFHVLLFDFRGRGESGRAKTSMGAVEAIDASAAIDCAAARIPDARIGLIGFSMGATVAVLAAAGDPRIGAVVLDSPYASPARVIRARLKRFFPITRALLVPILARMWALLLFGQDIGGIDAPSCARRIAVSGALVIVSGKDSFIPPAQQREVFEALPLPKELWEEPEADHCGAYFRDRKAYVERIIDFFGKNLG
jgi:pimeloyl-ACP methyl ester carboxylesterase